MILIRRIAAALKKSFARRRSRLEWLGVILALPFAASGVYLLFLTFGTMNPIHKIQCYAGSIFAVGMAIGIYGTAWGFATSEPHHCLAACSLVLEGLGCLILAVAIEHLLIHEMEWWPIAIPIAVYLVGIVLGVIANREKKRTRGPARSQYPD